MPRVCAGGALLVAGRWMGQPGFASLHKHADHWDPQRALVISDALLQTDRTLPRRLPMWRATATGRARQGKAQRDTAAAACGRPRGGCCACGRPPWGLLCVWTAPVGAAVRVDGPRGGCCACGRPPWGLLCVWTAPVGAAVRVDGPPWGTAAVRTLGTWNVSHGDAARCRLGCSPSWATAPGLVNARPIGSSLSMMSAAASSSWSHVPSCAGKP
jgi:hypothetical protein